MPDKYKVHEPKAGVSGQEGGWSLNPYAPENSSQSGVLDVSHPGHQTSPSWDPLEDIASCNSGELDAVPDNTPQTSLKEKHSNMLDILQPH